MINIFFPVGMFGTTIEYTIRRFAKGHGASINSRNVNSDGSMHVFNKLTHLLSFEQDFSTDDSNILTTIYPNRNLLDPLSTIEKWKSILGEHAEKTIFIRPQHSEDIYRNELFAYHKTKEVYVPNILDTKATVWSNEYESGEDMQRWEKREALSLHVNQRVKDFDNIQSVAEKSWLQINPDEILYNLYATVEKVFFWAGLERNENDLTAFCHEWHQAQAYIVNEFFLVESIVDAVINNRKLEWDSNNLSLMGESLVQAKLSNAGLEIECAGLNDFPNNSEQIRGSADAWNAPGVSK